MQVLETAEGAILHRTGFSLVRIRPGCRQESLLRKFGVGGGGRNFEILIVMCLRSPFAGTVRVPCALSRPLACAKIRRMAQACKPSQPKEQRRRHSEKQSSKTVLLESLSSAPLKFALKQCELLGKPSNWSRIGAVHSYVFGRPLLRPTSSPSLSAPPDDQPQS